MDFSAWFEVFLGEPWWTFDARHNARARKGANGDRTRRNGLRDNYVIRKLPALISFQVTSDEKVQTSIGNRLIYSSAVTAARGDWDDLPIARARDGCQTRGKRASKQQFSSSPSLHS